MRNVIANGAEIPSLGFGTYGMRGSALMGLIESAVRAGFRHIDTAQVYGNEAEVGDGVIRSGVRRADIFLTTKVWVENCRGDNFARSVDDSLRRLRTDHVDLLLLHWPNKKVPLAEQIGLLNDTAATGRAKHIGISNFNRALMADAVRLSERPLAANQFEFHPFLGQRLLVPATRSAGLAVVAYCAMAIGRVFTNPTLLGIAASHQRAVSQVVLRWLVQQPGVVALTRTSRPERIPDNLDIFDFELTHNEMAAVGRLATTGSRIVNPPGLAPDWD